MISQYGVSIKKVHSLHTNLYYHNMCEISLSWDRLGLLERRRRDVWYEESRDSPHKSKISKYCKLFSFQIFVQGKIRQIRIVLIFRNFMKYSCFPKTGNNSSFLTWNLEQGGGALDKLELDLCWALIGGEDTKRHLFTGCPLVFKFHFLKWKYF